MFSDHEGAETASHLRRSLSHRDAQNGLSKVRMWEIVDLSHR